MSSADLSAPLETAIAHHRAGRLVEAQACYREILAAAPQHFDAMHLLGVTQFQLGHTAAAARTITAALAVREDPGALVNLALAQSALGQKEDSLASLDRSLALQPNQAEANNNRGTLLLAMKRPAEALESFDRALHIRPDYAEALNNRSSALRDLYRFDEALTAAEQSLRLRPDDLQTLHSRALALKGVGRIEEAARQLDHVIGRAPAHAAALSDRGTLHELLANDDAALADYRAALAADPTYAPAHGNMSMVLLRRGDFEAGWSEYEWRFRQDQKDFYRVFSQPLWRGEDIAGKTILLHAEQGFGDTLQFCRYARMVAARGARVLLEVGRPLVGLMQTLDGASGVFRVGEPLPAFDVHCPLMSLPFVFRTRLENIPADVPYLYADDARRRAWGERLGPRSKPRIGICWSGSARPSNDGRRSLTLETFLGGIPPDVEAHTLQKDVRPADAAVLAAHPEIFDHTAAQTSFAEAAGLIAHMDLVVSIDTSLAHLAGAMGTPTWVLLPYVPEWRWLTNRSDSPWYPTMRLFRQSRPMGWDSLLADVRLHLMRTLSP